MSPPSSSVAVTTTAYLHTIPAQDKPSASYKNTVRLDSRLLSALMPVIMRRSTLRTAFTTFQTCSK